MVSTRHRTAANEESLLAGLSQGSRMSNQSPSPKKRKLVAETPEQLFVDARQTPFTERRRSLSNDDSVSASTVTTPRASFPDLQNSNEESVGNTSAAIERIEDIEKDQDEGSVSDSDDDAPEAVSNVTSARAEKALEQARMQQSKDRADEIREKRRNRDKLLRSQKGTLRKLDERTTDGPRNEQLDQSEIPRKAVVPRMLPDEILNAAPILPSSLVVEASSERVSSHIKFEAKNEITRLRKGQLTLEVLKKQRKDLAPRKTASVANTRNQWLYSRGEHSTNRRPIKKPLA